MDIRLAISKIRPTSEYHWLSLGDDNYESIGEWRDKSATKPTLAELESAWQSCLADQSIENAKVLRKKQAIAEARLASELKTVTPTQAVNYIENNVTTLASAKVVLKIMARMMIAMRDEIWPELGGE